jgi:hypothetical protein
MDIDEVALNTLLADGIDAPTAYAASVESTPARLNRAWFDAGLLAGLALYVFWLFF